MINSEFKFLLLIFLFFSSITIGGWVFSSSIEAKAYNRLTGSDVTTWEAMFLELRVDGDR